MKFLPELLIPVGDRDKLFTALAYGADAVYLGGQRLSLRAKTSGFDFQSLQEAVKLAHTRNVLVYFTLNLLAWEEHLEDVIRYLEELGQSGIDGIIIADPGIVSLARKRIPHIPIHLSTQANTSNSAAAEFWKDIGVSRINVARELGAERIRAMAQKVSGLELEVFVHGAMCMAISGRCMLSAHLNQRSANLGECTHPCRFDYKITGVKLEERLRPDQEMWEIHEEDEYTQIMGAQDLCLVKYLRWFQRVGIHSLKIEGRMKTPSYLAQVTDVYRTALNDLTTDNFRPALYLDELQQLATRPLSTGFFTPHRLTMRPALLKHMRKNIVGRIIEQIRPGTWLLDVKYRFQNGSPLEIVIPGLQRPVLYAQDYGVEKEDGTRVSTAHSGLRMLFHCEYPGLKPDIFLRAHTAEGETS